MLCKLGNVKSKNLKCSQTRTKKKENGAIPLIMPTPSFFLSPGPRKVDVPGLEGDEKNAQLEGEKERDQRCRAGGGLQAEPARDRGKEESLESLEWPREFTQCFHVTPYPTLNSGSLVALSLLRLCSLPPASLPSWWLMPTYRSI